MVASQCPRTIYTQLVGNGLREPINAIISGHSDPEILTEAGLRDYVRSIGFSFECLDLHRGGAQHANLGDGAGWRPQLFEYRSTQSFGAPGRWVGACWESWNGGDHFRVWKQNGSEAKTGAWFLAVSREKSLRHRHTIAPNGYNEGRDLLVFNAVAGGEFGQKRWKADVKWVEGLMPSGSEGINHGIAIDGMTAVLTVQREFSGYGRTLRPSPSRVAHARTHESDRSERSSSTVFLCSQATGVCPGQSSTLLCQSSQLRPSGQRAGLPRSLRKRCWAFCDSLAGVEPAARSASLATASLSRFELRELHTHQLFFFVVISQLYLELASNW